MGDNVAGWETGGMGTVVAPELAAAAVLMGVEVGVTSGLGWSTGAMGARGIMLAEVLLEAAGAGATLLEVVGSGVIGDIGAIVPAAGAGVPLVAAAVVDC